MSIDEQRQQHHAPPGGLPGRLQRRRRYIVRRVILPAAQFLRTEAGGGIVLLLATIVAIAWANSPWDEHYFDLLDRHIAIETPWLTIDESIHHWINDGLMAIFFFVVGLEIKREVLHGELASPRQAALPAAAALGGMVAPAAIFFAFNVGGEGEQGWGVPMATDIAFAVGVLALLGNRIPFGLKIFLLALAIVDDLGAIAVIAIFYTDEVAFEWLLAAVALVGVILVMQRAGIRSVDAYIVAGVVLWVAVLESGIHATIAGVALGLLTPASPWYRPDGFPGTARDLVAEYEAAHAAGDHETAGGILQQMEEVSRDTEAVLDRLEHRLHPWSSYVVVPLFALANAGLVINADTIESALSSPVTAGVFFGLVVGKIIGIVLVSWLAVTLGFCGLPRGVHWGHIAGSGLLAGIGFTVALFITELAFDDAALVDEARVGIFAASLVAALAGLAVLWLTSRSTTDAPLSRGEPEPAGEAL